MIHLLHLWGKRGTWKPEFDIELKFWVWAAGVFIYVHMRLGQIRCWRHLEFGFVKKGGRSRPRPGVPSPYSGNSKYESEQRWEFWAWTKRSWNGDDRVERASNFDQDWVPNATAEEQAPPSAGDPTVYKEGGTKQWKSYTERWVTLLIWVLDKQCFMGMTLLFLYFLLIFCTCLPSMEFVNFLINLLQSRKHLLHLPSTEMLHVKMTNEIINVGKVRKTDES